MPSTLENELGEIYEREVEKLIESESKYQSVLGAAEVSAVVEAFRFAIEHGVDNVTVQVLYDMIDNSSGD
jgi:hypothetical protein